VQGAVQVAFAPAGDALAIASRDGVAVEAGGSSKPILVQAARRARIAWARGRLVVARAASSGLSSLLWTYRVDAGGAAVREGRLELAGRVEALDGSGESVAVGVDSPSAAARLLASAVRADGPGPAVDVLVQLGAGTRIDAVSLR
jgi:hypothetical protein